MFYCLWESYRFIYFSKDCKIFWLCKFFCHFFFEILIFIISFLFLVIFFLFNYFSLIFIILFFFPFFFFFKFNFFFLSKNFYFSFDRFSYLLFLLTYWVIFLSLISSYYLFSRSFFFLFFILFFLLYIFLFIFFVSSNILIFFFSFESTLFPIYLIVLGWGRNIERLQSGLYLFFYTLFSSIPILVSIFFVLKLNNSLFFYFLWRRNSIFIYFFFILSFLIKMPMFLFHSWLPKAHVEAPVSGSIILAGVLLKIGGYGIYRFFDFFITNFNNIFIYISLWGGIIRRIICLRQFDLKSLIAFSSVSHIRIVILGLLIFNEIGIKGSFILIVAHGLCSSCMFFLANVVYERSGTRRIFLNKGLLSVYPSFSFWWFFFCSFNLGCPPSLNLLREIYIFITGVYWNFFFFFILRFLSFLGGAYNLFLFSFLSHGKISSFLNFFNSLSVRENFIVYNHFFPLIFFFLKIDLFYFVSLTTLICGIKGAFYAQNYYKIFLFNIYVFFYIFFLEIDLFHFVSFKNVDLWNQRSILCTKLLQNFSF